MGGWRQRRLEIYGGGDRRMDTRGLLNIDRELEMSRVGNKGCWRQGFKYKEAGDKGAWRRRGLETKGNG